MNHDEFRKIAYRDYFRTHFRQYAFNKPSRRLFERAAKGLEHNYGRYLKRLRPGARVLDVGCGAGHCLYYLWKKGFHAEGLDLSSDQLEQARKALPPDIPLQHAEARDFLRSNKGRYDGVLCTDVLEHLTRPEALELLQLVHQKLSAGGIVMLRLPNAASPLGIFTSYDDVTHERPYTEGSARQILAIAGFQDIKVSVWEIPIKTPLHVIPWLIRRVAWSLYKFALFLGDFCPGPTLVSRTLVACGTKESQNNE